LNIIPTNVAFSATLMDW